MSELEQLQNLARASRLLEITGDTENMRRTSAEFTRRAASLLRRDGWRLLKARTGARAVNGVRIDRIINRDSLAIVEILSNPDDPSADAPPRAVVWNPIETGIVTDVADDNGTIGGAPGAELAAQAPAIELPGGAELAAAAHALTHAIAANTEAVRALLDKVAEIQRQGVQVRFR